MTTINIAVLASGTGTNFDAIELALRHVEEVNVVGVISNNKDAAVLQKAKKLGYDTWYLDHRGCSRETLDSKIVTALKMWEVDLIVFAGWMRIVTSVLVNEYKDRILNVHPSILPSFKGHKAVELALEAGVKVSGCTIHIVEEGVDSGKILYQIPVFVQEDDTPEILHNRIKEMEYKFYPPNIIDYAKKIGKRKSY